MRVVVVCAGGLHGKRIFLLIVFTRAHLLLRKVVVVDAVRAP